jgi:F-actin capping protein alpha subunit
MSNLESLLASAPPGQLDNLIKDLSSLMTIPPEVLDSVKSKTNHPSMTTRESLSTPLSQALYDEWMMDPKKVVKSNSDSSGGGRTVTMTEDGHWILSTEWYDPKNAYAGLCQGHWIIRCDIPDDSTHQDYYSASIEGSIMIRVYCYEDANIQLEVKRDYPPIPVPSVVGVSKDKDDTDNWKNLACAIRKRIDIYEAELDAELEDVYNTMDDKLKALRRVLPVMRTRLEWNVLAHRMVKTLEETTNAANGM